MADWVVFLDKRTTANNDPNLLTWLTHLTSTNTTPTKQEIISAISGMSGFDVGCELLVVPLANGVKIHAQVTQTPNWTITVG